MADYLRNPLKRPELYLSDWVTIDFEGAPAAEPDPLNDLSILEKDAAANPSFNRPGQPLRCGPRADLSLAATAGPILHDPLKRHGTLATYSYDTCHISWPNVHGRRLAVTFMCFTTLHQVIATTPDGRTCGGDQRGEASVNAKIFSRTNGLWRELGDVETGNVDFASEHPPCRNAVP